ncbi:MAG: ArsA-related P-loop ATPase, partial [Chloroflexota bacterium]|nr:ArsA-related P-loop ATPase [Chloroflexota bacterium]
MVEKRVIMFGGKGGVGKTTSAAATALHYARKGLNTLIISTDPMPSLADIFEVSNSQKLARVTDNLHLSELGTEEVKGMWNSKFGPEVYELFSSMVSIEYAEFVDFITSILPGLQEEFMVDYIKE